MKPRARRARRILRDRWRHNNDPWCLVDCMECAAAEDPFDARMRILDALTTMGELARLVANPDAPAIIRGITDEFRRLTVAALGKMEPTNRLGFTEEAWNQWRDDTAKWQAANPIRHAPYEACDCTGIPMLRAGHHGHCAVRGPVVPWEETRS